MNTVPDPGPEILSRLGPPCRLCSNRKTWVIHFPPFQFVSGDFRAVPWCEHEKYYCPDCQFLWANWLGNSSLEEYGEEYVKANTDDQRRPTEERMIMAAGLLSYLLHRTGGSRFLDYGIGYNVPYIYELRGRGIDAWGCDISKAVPYSRFVVKLPSETLPQGTFDGIYSTEVMEHLYHFREDFQTMINLLKPGGMMLHQTPALFDYWDGIGPFPRHFALWTPYHVSVFSDTSARILAQQMGLEYKGQVTNPGGKGFLFKKQSVHSLQTRLLPLSPASAWRSWLLFQHQLYLLKNYGTTPPMFRGLRQLKSFIDRAHKRGLVGGVKRLGEKLLHKD